MLKNKSFMMEMPVEISQTLNSKVKVLIKNIIYLIMQTIHIKLCQKSLKGNHNVGLIKLEYLDLTISIIKNISILIPRKRVFIDYRL